MMSNPAGDTKADVLVKTILEIWVLFVQCWPVYLQDHNEEKDGEAISWLLLPQMIRNLGYNVHNPLGNPKKRFWINYEMWSFYMLIWIANLELVSSCQ